MSQEDVLRLVRAGAVDFGIGTAPGKQYELASRHLSSDVPIRSESNAGASGITIVRDYAVSLPLTIVGMVEGGLGVGVATTALARLADTLGLTLKKLTATVVRHEVALILHPERSLSPAAQNFRDFIVQHGSGSNEA